MALAATQHHVALHAHGLLLHVVDKHHPAHALVRDRVLKGIGFFCKLTSAPAPLETPARDHRFGTNVPLAVLAADMAHQAAGIAYPN